MFHRYEIVLLPDGTVQLEFHHAAGSWVVRLPGALADQLATELQVQLLEAEQYGWAVAVQP